MTFWGAQWEKLTSLSGGASPASFKGVRERADAESASRGRGYGEPTRGTARTRRPGVPSYIGIIVASTDSKSGSTISGNVVAIAIVRTAAGYEGNPGHAATGTVVAVIH